MVEVQRLAAGLVGGVLAGRSLNAELAALWRRRAQSAARDRSAIQDLAYGTLRFLGWLEAVLEALLQKPLRDTRLRALLLVALYQLEHTRAAPHAVVDHAVRTCEVLGLASAKGLTNAVLRNFLRDRTALGARVQRLETARFCHPQWWIEKLRAQYPSHYAAALEADNLHPPLALRVNQRRVATETYLALLAQQGIRAEAIGETGVVLASPLPADRIPGLADGLVSVQDTAAQLAAPLLDLRDGMRVLDACAAPGGKTTHALELADVDLVALDSDERRLERVHANLARLGLNARVVCGDAAESGTWWDGKPFERVLADVPCSASGVARRHPDIKWLRRAADVAQFAQVQRHMLDALWQLLGRGGKLLYATCSVFLEENGEQVAHFVERHPDATRLTLPALDDDPRLPAGQLLQTPRHDGFFYALLQKA
ncbi:MAG: 16S rRNA (cytosine(967)-C(5))-methyltransferase RsmB [Betaproteobacteria bacterium]|nr:16S rRNA (cytosine(967)-C(5))-methyltransferase RsmB [Betaproteobacteria bacterium]MDH3435420.1 16S rRNA (cytosine(967)-C(5))-methyltransferase RsmB [Betaproteobacteria bacterium]